MKLVKILSLAAIAAIAAMAFVGTSSASAKGGVLLCKNPELICENPWPSGSTWVGHATNPKLLSSIGTVECEKSLIEISVLQPTLQVLQLAHILSLTLEGNCHLGGTSCTVTVKELGGMSLTHGANPLEWLYVLVPLEGRNTVKTVKCGFFINCTYTGGEETVLSGTSNGAGETTITANEAELAKTAGICPKISKLDVTYVGLSNSLYFES